MLVCCHCRPCVCAQGVELIWTMAMDTHDDAVSTNAIRFLNLLYQKLGASLRDSVKEVRRGYVELATEKLRGAVEVGNPVHVLRTVSLLETMLNESELSGTGSVPSHRQRLKGRLLSIPVVNGTAIAGTAPAYTVRAYSNATLFDVRKMIADKVGLPVSRLQLRQSYIPGSTSAAKSVASAGGKAPAAATPAGASSELGDADNGRTLVELRFTKSTQVAVPPSPRTDAVPELRRSRVCGTVWVVVSSPGACLMACVVWGTRVHVLVCLGS